jgi:hypothetical protein
MKKLFYVLPILGLLCFVSCDKDESEEIIDQSTAFDQIEITENTNSKGFGLVFAPGLYGPNNADALTNVTYTFHPSQAMLNSIPIEKRKYRIYFRWMDYPPNALETLWHFEIPSNSVNIKFPRLRNYNTCEFRVQYELYGNGKNYLFTKSSVIVNNE